MRIWRRGHSSQQLAYDTLHSAFGHRKDGAGLVRRLRQAFHLYSTVVLNLMSS
jgi:hypothetical protein